MWNVVYQRVSCTVHGTHYLFDSKIFTEIALFSGSRTLFTNSQTSFLTKTFIKNGSYCTIHIFKNYFATVFLIFSF